MQVRNPAAARYRIGGVRKHVNRHIRALVHDGEHPVETGAAQSEDWCQLPSVQQRWQERR